MTLFEIVLLSCAVAFTLSAPFVIDSRRASEPRRQPAEARGAAGRRDRDKLTDIHPWTP